MDCHETRVPLGMNCNHLADPSTFHIVLQSGVGFDEDGLRLWLTRPEAFLNNAGDHLFFGGNVP